MSPAEQSFLNLLSAYLRGEQPEELPQAWEEILKLARINGVTGLLWDLCRAVPGIPEPVSEQLHSAFLSEVFLDTCRNTDFREVTEALRQAGVEVVAMKGMVLRDAYPTPQLRTMGDVDLVIRPRDREASHNIMTSLGFSAMVDNHAVWTYQRDVVTYEIHDHMMYEDLANGVDYTGYFDRVWEHLVPGPCGVAAPEPEFHFLYLVVHQAKHIMNRGNGFRFFLDLAFFCRTQKLNWEWVRGELEKLQLLEFTKTCFTLCHRWFGAEMPLPDREISEAFFREITEKTFRDGLFGFHNQDNQMGGSAKAIRRSGLPYWLSTLKLTIHRLFPPYRDMQLIPWYSFVDGRPWLLPVAWVYRFFYCLRHKAGHSRSLLEEPYLHREAIERRQEMLSQWGL